MLRLIPQPLVIVTQRLPCRGCLPSCPNYAHCDGKIWRPNPAVNELTSHIPLHNATVHNI